MDGGRGVDQGRVEFIYIFFGHITILFHQYNTKNIIYQHLLLFTLYILHIVNITAF